MKILGCLSLVTCILSSPFFVSLAWSDEASIPIVGAKGVIMSSGIIAKIEGNRFTIKNSTATLFIIAEIDRRQPIDRTDLMQFKVGKRVKIRDGKISTLPDPLPKPIRGKETLPDPLPKTFGGREVLPDPIPKPTTGQ